jgi:hypothetical protein
VGEKILGLTATDHSGRRLASDRPKPDSDSDSQYGVLRIVLAEAVAIVGGCGGGNVGGGRESIESVFV